MRSLPDTVLRWAAPRVPRLQAITLFGLGAAVLASGMPLAFVVDGLPALPPTHPVRLVTLAAICAAELSRTRAPAAGLSVGVVVMAVELPFGISLGVLIAFTDLLFAATLNGSERTKRVILAVVGTVVVGALAGSVLLAHSWRALVPAVLSVCLAPLLPVWWAMNVRHQRDLAREHQQRADHVARIAELDRQAAVAAERSRMARDLHDVIAGHLSAIAIQSAAVLSTVDGDPAATRRVLESVRENSVESLAEMHAMIRLLRSADGTLDERTAPARLRDMGKLLDSARAAGLDVHVEMSGVDDLPAAVDLSAYRIVQEALTNAVKHAPDSRVEVTVALADESLVVTVTNGYRDRAPAPGSGRGLLNMGERARAVGGVLSAGPCGDGRWRVRAELPAERERV